MFHAVVATAMVAAGAAALNELLERDLDAKMKRTASRPIPSGQMTPETALIIGAACSAAGLNISVIPIIHKLLLQIQIPGSNIYDHIVDWFNNNANICSISCRQNIMPCFFNNNPCII